MEIGIKIVEMDGGLLEINVCYIYYVSWYCVKFFICINYLIFL